MRVTSDCAACSVGLYATVGPTGACLHDHEQVLADSPAGTVNVDQGVLPLVRTLWSAGVRTWTSCQGHKWEPRSGYVMYHADDHALGLAVVSETWPLSALVMSGETRGLCRIGFPAMGCD